MATFDVYVPVGGADRFVEELDTSLGRIHNFWKVYASPYRDPQDLSIFLFKVAPRGSGDREKENLKQHLAKLLKQSVISSFSDRSRPRKQ